MRHDTLADGLSAIKNSEKVGKGEVTIPASKLVKDFLRIAQENSYIGQFEWVDDGKSGSFKIKLVGKITDCGVIKPRHSVKVTDMPKWEERYLPSRNFGLLVVSTPSGIMTHNQAKDKNIGGKLLSYIY